MQSEIYPNINTKEEYNIFEFFSVGNRGILLKRAIFSNTEYQNIYALILGDVNANDEIDEYNVSDNGDRNKILATVINIIGIHLNKYPKRSIYFTGNSVVRTRLYRMVITLNFEELSKKWIIYSQTDNGFVPFEKNIHTKGFLIKRKLYCNMKKKIVKYKSSFSNQVIKLTVDEKKTGIDLRKMAPLKLAIINEALKGMKFPD